ncbi:endonuclease [Vibrio phage JSF24]|jgi:hypothetical protein|uniref:Endonuclease n=4 Tax=Chatterjeevirus ICP3 TaxID=2733612 RepID=A0A2D0YWX3_9CAUD|nr:endonuclease I [Vibrio phage ICP3_2009_B]ASV43248.1 endonuclease [Vibrio phage JSF20]ASV43296.1 endonuclease [Vibrio phage JSF24]ASV43344.1 endonuclease [Vibrio phage JSF34]
MAAKSWFRKSAGAVVYRSGLEDNIAKQLEAKGLPVSFESHFLNYIKPQTSHKYTPDFILPNGIIIESKGLFDVEDRKKHLLIKEQYPDLEIRFVFSRSATKLYKGSKTTYADWCIKYGFKFADKLIPVEWLREKSIIIPEGVLHAKKGDK